MLVELVCIIHFPEACSHWARFGRWRNYWK